MTPVERKELARAVCCWLAYKELTGASTILSEAMLTLPIAEYLMSRTNWILKPEFSYRKLRSAGHLPDIWCDFAATRKYGQGVQFILEAKFLKTKAVNMSRQIAADLIRLSLAPTESLKRYFLLAGASKHFPDANANFLFRKNVFALKPPNGGIYINPFDEASRPDLIKAFPVFERLLATEDSVNIPKSAWLQCCAIEEISVGDSFRVAIWSVGRAKASETDSAPAGHITGQSE